MPLDSRGSARPRRRARPAQRGQNALPDVQRLFNGVQSVMPSVKRVAIVALTAGAFQPRAPLPTNAPARRKDRGEQVVRRSFSVRLAINNRAGLGRHAHSRCVVLPTQRTRAGPSPAGTPRTAPRFAVGAMVGVDRVAGAADRVGEVGRGNGCRSRAHAHATCSTCARWMPPHSCTRAMLTSPRDTKSNTLPYRIRFLRRQQHACKALLERTWGTSVRAIARSADASLGAAMTRMHR
jgi:hypothetical protein